MNMAFFVIAEVPFVRNSNGSTNKEVLQRRVTSHFLDDGYLIESSLPFRPLWRQRWKSLKKEH